jgi:hypothetical protein
LKNKEKKRKKIKSSFLNHETSEQMGLMPLSKVRIPFCENSDNNYYGFFLQSADLAPKNKKVMTIFKLEFFLNVRIKQEHLYKL